MKIKSASIVILTFLFISCSSRKIDYQKINKSLASKEYQQAIQQIDGYRQFMLTPLDQKKLNQLYITADKGLLFDNLENIISAGDSIELKAELVSIKQQIQSRDSLAQRWYFFDFYLAQSHYHRILKDSSNQLNNLLLAVEYPVRDIQKKIDAFLDLAFYYANTAQFEKAREWLDKALRSFNKSDMDGKLLDVYMAYMNGNYSKSDSILALIPQKNKNSSWQRIESFFNLYLNSLSLKNRFRLW